MPKLILPRLLLADPGWFFHDNLPGRRGASKHHRVWTVSELMRFPLPPLADDCLLLLWRVSAMQQEALDVARAWGFTVKGEIIWNKLTSTGKEHFGMGRIVRNAHEVCLIGTRGRPVIHDHSVRSTFSAPVQGHSRKPEDIYEIAERLTPGPYVELRHTPTHAPRYGWMRI